MYEVIDKNGILFLGDNGIERIPFGKFIKNSHIENNFFSEGQLNVLLKRKQIKKINNNKKLDNKKLDNK